MKIIGELKSKQGHEKHDYLVSISPNELFILKKMIAHSSTPAEQKNKKEIERNSFRSLQQFFRALEVRRNGEIITML